MINTRKLIYYYNAWYSIEKISKIFQVSKKLIIEKIKLLQTIKKERNPLMTKICKYSNMCYKLSKKINNLFR